MNKNSIKPWLALLLLAVGATTRFDLTLIARVPASELIAFGSLPFVLRGVPFGRFSHRIWPVVGILALWALGILISDFVNGFSMGRFLRGFAKPVWCLLWMLFFICVIYRDFRALLWYPAGTVLAALQNYFLPQAWTIDAIQEGGYSAAAYGITPIISATALFFALQVYAKSRILAAFCLLVSMLALIWFEAPRSSIAIYALDILIILYIAWTRRRGGKVLRLTWGKLAGFGALGLLAVWVIFAFYVYAASQGWLGELQRGKLLSQSNTVFGDSPLGLILGGRTAVFGAILAILDKPFLGYGSWMGITLSEYYFDAVSYVGTDANELARLTEMGGGATPGHSIIFGVWMENGLLAAIGVLGIAGIVLKEFIAVIQRDSRIAPLLILFGTSFMWAFFFSPFGTNHRLMVGLFLAFHVMAFHRLQPQGQVPEMRARAR